MSVQNPFCYGSFQTHELHANNHTYNLIISKENEHKPTKEPNSGSVTNRYIEFPEDIAV